MRLRITPLSPVDGRAAQWPHDHQPRQLPALRLRTRPTRSAARSVLLVGGASSRWTAPVLVGWLGGAALVLRELVPYAVHAPQWMVIGAAGAVLIGAGVTWEARVRDLRRAAAFMARQR